MKKNIKLLGISLLLALLLVSCKAGKDDNKLIIGLSPEPHRELVEFIKEDFEKEGYKLEIVEFTDYVKPNLSLADGEIDLNFFQHQVYLDSFKDEKNLDLISIGSIHLEPMGLYSKSLNSIKDLKDGSQIAIPNDVSNGGRALLILEKEGLIKLNKDKGILATEKDIISNPKNLEIIALEAPSLPRIVEDIDGAIINGNYALEAGFKLEDALLLEDSSSPYPNIVAIRAEDKDDKKILKLLRLLQSEKMRKHIEENYRDSILPAF